MAYSRKSCLSFIFLLLSVEMMMKIPSVDAISSCMEGMPAVDVTCRRSEADQSCWIACQQKYGPAAEAWCRSVTIGLPAQVCMCTYPCTNEYLRGASGAPRSTRNLFVIILPLFCLPLFL
ncbi:hypothetical protein CASFOL_008826 [Castilleja foliolosa]|uniref:Uncharacterized protein n=1 Tax=Castilleja foliolosa TaxID=1961234 RepID=A0ABD3E039_9LAMI